MANTEASWQSLPDEQKSKFYCLAGAGNAATIITPYGAFGVSGTLMCTHPEWMLRKNTSQGSFGSTSAPSEELAQAAHRLWVYQEGIRPVTGYPGGTGVSPDVYRQHKVRLIEYVQAGGHVQVAVESEFVGGDNDDDHNTKTLWTSWGGGYLAMVDGELTIQRRDAVLFQHCQPVTLHDNSVDDLGRAPMVYVNFPQNGQNQASFCPLGRIPGVQPPPQYSQSSESSH